jgi:hypothetical protein
VLVVNDVSLRVNGNAIDGEEEVAALDAGSGTGRSGSYLDGGDAFRAGTPQNPVLDFMPPGISDDVGDAERTEQEHDGQRKDRAAPHPPPGLGWLRSSRSKRQLRVVRRRRDWG